MINKINADFGSSRSWTQNRHCSVAIADWPRASQSQAYLRLLTGIGGITHARLRLYTYSRLLRLTSGLWREL